jgi:PadR family transcriptional regulator PadR
VKRSGIGFRSFVSGETVILAFTDWVSTGTYMSELRLEPVDETVERILEFTSFQRDLLFVIAGSERASGQEVKAELEDSTGESILPGQLYPNLDELHEAGLLRKSNRDGRTNDYALTECGREVLAELCRWQCAHAHTEEFSDVQVTEY